MPLLDPNTIVIRREERQRREIDTAELQQSIAELGQIVPIVVETSGDTFVLIAGERRLEACRALGIEVKAEFWTELTPFRRALIEYEENAKRSDLPWRDNVAAAGQIHALGIETHGPSWNIAATAKAMSMTYQYMNTILAVHKALGSTLLENATSIVHAYGILQRAAERKAASIVESLAQGAQVAFAAKPEIPVGPSAAPTPAPSIPLPMAGGASEPSPMGGSPTPPLLQGDDFLGSPVSVAPPPAIPAPQVYVPPSQPIICADFLSWAPEYSGPKFNLIHCDFPYGVRINDVHGITGDGDIYDNDPEIYWALTKCLTANIDRLMSYSAHLIFWFSMNFYSETKRALEGAGLNVHNHPFIWYKSDNKGIAPARGSYPKRVYDTALIAVRGNRPLVKQIANCYPSPTPEKMIHPSQKSEPMLRHLMSMVVDNTTTVFDPTAGSGSALRAAEDAGAAAILGLEMNPNFAEAANAVTQKARTLRLMGRAV